MGLLRLLDRAVTTMDELGERAHAAELAAELAGGIAAAPAGKFAHWLRPGAPVRPA